MKKLGMALGVLVAIAAATYGYLYYEEWRKDRQWIYFKRNIGARPMA
jgi:hypothetical protein